MVYKCALVIPARRALGPICCGNLEGVCKISIEGEVGEDGGMICMHWVHLTSVVSLATHRGYIRTRDP